jgi:hypothetical protein
MLDRSPFLGPVFECFVASEIVKHQLNGGRARALYYFRDQQGLEVDFVVPAGGKRITLIEAKASRTVHPAQAKPLLRLAAAMKGYRSRSVLIHRSAQGKPFTKALAAGTSAVPASELASVLESRKNYRSR